VACQLPIRFFTASTGPAGSAVKSSMARSTSLFSIRLGTYFCWKSRLETWKSNRMASSRPTVANRKTSHARLTNLRKAVLLEDPEQQLYKDRVAFNLPEAVSITSYENFRTPRSLVKLINLLKLTTVEVEAQSPHEGVIPDPIVYATPEKITYCTVKAVERCLQRGFSLDEIAVVSMRGREHSVVQNLSHLEDWSLNRFTGKFDEGSNPIWSGGQLLLESVRRFKGQAAPAVVLTQYQAQASAFRPGSSVPLCNRKPLA